MSIPDFRYIGVGERITFFSDGLLSSGDILFSLLKGFKNPESIMISTWQLGKNDAIRLVNLKKNSGVELRILLDASYSERCKKYFEYVKKYLGDRIWFTRNHCKVMTVAGDGKFITVLSSANFNKNYRLEFFDITESRSLYDMTNKAHEKFFLEESIATNKNNYNGYVKTFKASRNG